MSSDNNNTEDKTAWRTGIFSGRLRRFVVAILVAIYCFAIFFALDFLYSTFFYRPEGIPGIADPLFHHTLVPNYDGYDQWGERHYRFVTNSLGFRDAAVRPVSAKPSYRRVVLIGDSFTEGIGLPFEETFAGMLARAGQQRADKTEFLNAAVVSYSPTLYYRKIKFLLDSGLVFDEVVVFPDLSDVQDEATRYFCFDDDPRYKTLCGDEKFRSIVRNDLGARLQRNFAMSDALRLIVKFKLLTWSGAAKREHVTPSPRIGWSIPNYDVGGEYAPLGVEGGIARAIEHMQDLAELLARRNIALTVTVYPWPLSLAQDDPGGRWVAIWRDFCMRKCKAFIDTFPDFVAARDAHADWYEKYFLIGDDHFSAASHRLIFDALTRSGL